MEGKNLPLMEMTLSGGHTDNKQNKMHSLSHGYKWHWKKSVGAKNKGFRACWWGRASLKRDPWVKTGCSLGLSKGRAPRLKKQPVWRLWGVFTVLEEQQGSQCAKVKEMRERTERKSERQETSHEESCRPLCILAFTLNETGSSWVWAEEWYELTHDLQETLVAVVRISWRCRGGRAKAARQVRWLLW